IVRFGDSDILNNIDGVYEVIQGVIENRKKIVPLTLILSPGRGRGNIRAKILSAKGERGCRAKRNGDLGFSDEKIIL
ncbi:MAG: hypothetical protein NTY34_00340, partial [Candidatus Omnitrophica bacterium]|nr:hypothetical protein [Candidatus Omnitrophota bacterium]